MKILLIDNNTKHRRHLLNDLAGHEVVELSYYPGVSFDWQDKDLIILSGGGGEGLEIRDTDRRGKLWYEDEMRLVRTCQKPIIGICMGFEVICRAFGERVEEMADLVQGMTRLQVTPAGAALFRRPHIRQLEAHRWRVRSVDADEFEVLAQSSTGVEIIRHRRRPIVATQFHPEAPGGTLNLPALMQTTLNLV